MKRPKNTTLQLLLLAAALFYIAFILRTSFRIAGITYFTLVDDAMVSMRYAQHLAQGFGMVWNVGEKPVEGFTNPGWMFFMAFLHLFPIHPSKISLIVMIASAVILLVNAFAAHRIAEVLQPESKYAPLLAAAVTAFYFPLVFWSLRGMEVGILTLLINWGVLVALHISGEERPRSSILLGLIFAMALLIRLDSIIQISVIVAYLLWVGKFSPSGIRWPLLMIILAAVAILVFQRAYFGDFLPNTYYQKMGGTLAWERIRNGLLVFYQHATRDTLVLAVFSLAGIVLYNDFRRPGTLLLAGLFMAHCAYSIWVGGDYAEVEVNAANRFITQGMPTLIILFSLVIDKLLSSPSVLSRLTQMRGPILQSALAVALALVTLAIISGQPWLRWASDNAPLLQADIRRTRLGLFIARNTSPQATIAVHAAGQIPYYSERKTIDLLGLNDPVVAKGPVTGPFYPGHDKWNYEYSIAQLKPDLIADNWIKLADFMQNQSEYRHLDNGIYIRKDSTLLNVDGLSQEYR